MKILTIVGAACALALCSSPGAHAATLASYPFTGSSLASTDTNLLSTASDLTLGAGLSDSTRFALTNGNNAPSLRVNTDETAATLALSRNAGDDFTFTLTPLGVLNSELQTLTFDLAVNSAAINSNVAVAASTDGGASFTTLGTITAFSGTAFTPESVSLASLAPGAGNGVLFAFVVWDNANNAAGYTAFDNITVTGSLSAVPEPGTWEIVAFGAIVLAAAWKSRHQVGKMA